MTVCELTSRANERPWTAGRPGPAGFAGCASSP